MDYYLAQKKRSFTRLHHRLQQRHPQLQLARQQTALIKLRRRLDDAVQLQVRQAVRQQERAEQRLGAIRPEMRVERLRQQLQQWQYRLQQSMQQQLNGNKQRFSNLAAQLEGVSPLATLARGFSVTTAADGQVVKKTQQLHPGDTLKTRLDDGWVESEVTAVTPIAPVKKPRRRSAS